MEGIAATILEVDAQDSGEGQEKGGHGAAHPVAMPLTVHGKLARIVRPRDPCTVDAPLEGDHVEAASDGTDHFLLQLLTSPFFCEIQLLNQGSQAEANFY